MTGRNKPVQAYWHQWCSHDSNMRWDNIVISHQLTSWLREKNSYYSVGPFFLSMSTSGTNTLTAYGGRWSDLLWWSPSECHFCLLEVKNEILIVPSALSLFNKDHLSAVSFQQRPPEYRIPVEPSCSQCFSIEHYLLKLPEDIIKLHIHGRTCLFPIGYEDMQDLCAEQCVWNE